MWGQVVPAQNMEIVNELVQYAPLVPLVMVVTQLVKDYVSDAQTKLVAVVVALLFVVADGGFSVMSVAKGLVLGGLSFGGWDTVKGLLQK